MADVLLTRRQGVIGANIGIDEYVLMDLESGSYFSLNPVGTHIWKSLDTPRTLVELRDAVCEEFDVEISTCEHDVTSFARDLLDAGLLDSQAAPRPQPASDIVER